MLQILPTRINIKLSEEHFIVDPQHQMSVKSGQ